MRRSGLSDRVTNTVISVVHQSTITILVRLTVRCSLIALLGAATFAMARDGAAGRTADNRPGTPGPVQLGHVEPRPITVPVVDGEGIRFSRLSTDEGLSQTKVSQILQGSGLHVVWHAIWAEPVRRLQLQIVCSRSKKSQQSQRGVRTRPLQGSRWRALGRMRSISR